jgi:hypothetical protein
MPTSLAMTIVALAIVVGSATLAASMFTVAGAGIHCGAVKVAVAPLPAVATIVPTVALPPGILFTLQLMPTLVVFVAAPDSVPDRVSVLPSSTDAFTGESVNEIPVVGGCAAGAEATPVHPLQNDMMITAIMVSKRPATIASRNDAARS